MFITKVLSYRKSWELLNCNFKQEFADILPALTELYESYPQLVVRSGNKFTLYRECWQDILKRKGWNTMRGPFETESGRSVSFSNIGPIKNQISVAATLLGLDTLNRWLFQQTAIANKYDIVKIPILLLPVAEFAATVEERISSRQSFESCQRQLELLAPLSHAYQFLILGFSDRYAPTEIFELQTDLLVNDSEVLIDRSIEFPPEYHQAGLNILSYFGTYISEQYPNENAKVKIEQDGKLVRLIIESKNGEREIIEKALNEYELFVTGKKQPEEITENQTLVLEMRNELRMAKFRVESQQDIIRVQSTNIDKLNENVNLLMGLIGEGLRNKPTITIDFKPSITLTNSSTLSVNMTGILSALGDLKQLVPSSGSEFRQLSDLEGAIKAIEGESDSAQVKKSPGMEKLKKLIEAIAEKDTTLNKIVQATESGLDTFKNLAGKYNSIAEWCGLPQVPKVFTNNKGG